MARCPRGQEPDCNPGYGGSIPSRASMSIIKSKLIMPREDGRFDEFDVEYDTSRKFDPINKTEIKRIPTGRIFRELHEGELPKGRITTLYFKPENFERSWLVEDDEK